MLQCYIMHTYVTCSDRNLFAQVHSNVLILWPVRVTINTYIHNACKIHMMYMYEWTKSYTLQAVRPSFIYSLGFDATHLL